MDLDIVRRAAAHVMTRARHVRIVDDAVASYAAALPATVTTRPDAAWEGLGDGEQLVAFIVTLAAINFGSGWFPALRAPVAMSTYRTVATPLARRFRERGPLGAEVLAAMTAGDVAVLLDQPANGGTGELIELFARAWNDLGRLLRERHDGSCARLVEAAGGSAERLVDLLARMPLFHDVARYDGEPVPFMKRAQLCCADLAIAFGGRTWGAFSDLARLTICADNLVPHVLRLDGMIACDTALVARIERGEPIAADSRAEVELRAAAVHAGELIVAAAKRLGRDLDAMRLDNLLWHRGQDPRYKVGRPRHLTRTTAY